MVRKRELQEQIDDLQKQVSQIRNYVIPHQRKLEDLEIEIHRMEARTLETAESPMEAYAQTNFSEIANRGDVKESYKNMQTESDEAENRYDGNAVVEPHSPLHASGKFYSEAAERFEDEEGV